MLKKLLTLSAVLTTSSGSIMQSTAILQENFSQIENSFSSRVDGDNSTEGYKEFITDQSPKLMYYGRVLKYYLANSVIVSATDIEKLYEISAELQDENGVKLSGQQLNLFVQNLIASTVNLSVYGTSSDQEFFAESFSKWMITPDDQKNKSWEILNRFFLDILPTLIKDGGTIFDRINEIKKRVPDIVESHDFVMFDTSLKAIPTNKVNLGYNKQNTIGWAENDYFFTGGISSLLKQFNLPSLEEKSSINLETVKEYTDVFQPTWMYDSFTPASAASIESFYAANSNHFSSIYDLNETLARYSRDLNNVPQINLIESITALEKAYILDQPTNTNLADYDQWTSQTTLLLYQRILTLYNYLWIYSFDSILWLANMCSALIIAADEVLNGSGVSTMGITVTYRLASENSTVESYVIVLGSALTFSEFNSQYSNGYWASPEKFSVIIHEFGHIIDSFASKINDRRNSFNATKSGITEKYGGTIFGFDFETYSNTTFVFLWILVSVISMGLLSLMIFVSIFLINKKNK